MASSYPSIQVVQAENVLKQRRRPRKPQHSFNLKSRPFELTPFMIAPVLPGETLDNLLMQSRVVSDPILNALIGWHKQYWFYYVPLRALGDPIVGDGTLQDNIIAMFVAGTALPAGMLAGANSEPFYSFKSGGYFVEKCLAAVTLEDFRDEDDQNLNLIDQYPGLYADRNNVFNSIKLESAGADDLELPGVDEIEELDILPGYTTAYAQWELMRDAGWTNVDFNTYLKSEGVSVPATEEVSAFGVKRARPELLRFFREWTYPTNAVDPTDGSVASAVSWSIIGRADKKRFFKEPGFICGYTTAAPKIYLGTQKGAAVGLLKTINHWLPAVLRGYPYASVLEELDTATDGILQNQTEDYWLDIKDLYLYGDQFINHTPSVTACHALALPDATVDNRSLFTTAFVKSFFVDAAGTANYIREDGVVHMTILSRIGPDTTPA